MAQDTCTKTPKYVYEHSSCTTSLRWYQKYLYYSSTGIPCINKVLLPSRSYDGRESLTTTTESCSCSVKDDDLFDKPHIPRPVNHFSCSIAMTTSAAVHHSVLKLGQEQQLIALYAVRWCDVRAPGTCTSPLLWLYDHANLRLLDYEKLSRSGFGR